MSGIIFLDFDGPIFPEKIHLYKENQGKFGIEGCLKLGLHAPFTYWYADNFAIAMLNELRKIKSYKLVISSSWADEKIAKKEQIENMLKANNLDYDMHEDWKTPREPLLRHEQIEKWLDNHPEITNNYFILDDTKSAPDMYFEKTYLTTKILKERVFLAHEKDGFNYEQFDDMKFAIERF